MAGQINTVGHFSFNKTFPVDYKKNEDMLCDDHWKHGGQNAVIDVIYPQESIEDTLIIDRDEVKNFCKIDVDEDDQLLDELQYAAISICEAATNIGFKQRDVVAILNNVNGGIFLPYGPITEIKSLSYDDSQTPSTDYNVQGVQWKQLLTASPRVTVSYVGGYQTLPFRLKTALLQCIFFLYDERKRRENGIGPIYKETLQPFSRND